MPESRMTRNRSAPGTVGRELWQQSHPFHHDESKDGGSDFCANPQNNSGTSAGGGPAQEVTTPSAFSAGLSMMASAFSSRPSPAVRARGPHLEARRLRAHTDMGKDAHVRMPGHVGHMPVANMGEHANIPLPREYAEDIGRTPDALESFSRICHLAARGDLEALKRKVAELPPGKLKLAGSLDNRAPLHFAAAAGHVEVCDWLLSQGVPINPVDGFGLTPLAEAVRWSHRDLARLLHARGGRLFISGELVTYHNFDAQVPLLNASMTDEDWEVDGQELKTEGMIGQGSFGLIFKATWRGTPVAIKQIHIQKGALPSHPTPPSVKGGLAAQQPAQPGAFKAGSMPGVPSRPLGLVSHGGVDDHFGGPNGALRGYGAPYASSTSQRDGHSYSTAGGGGTAGGQQPPHPNGAGLGGALADAAHEVGAAIGVALSRVTSTSPGLPGIARRRSQSAPGGTHNNPTLEAIVAELREELYLMSHLHHPHVLQFLGAVTKPGPHSPAIVMELALMTLAHAFRDNPRLPAAVAVASSIHVARGMAYLHGHSPHAIIHRDLKPSNVLMTAAGLWKVCDFGLSRLLPRTGAVSDDAYRMTGETGSYVYMAPEVYKHESYNLKVDQYAFAMILYQAFHGERPFARLRPVDAARAASTGRRPSELDRLPHAIRLVVTACWSDDPSRRPNFLDLVPVLETFAISKGLTRESNFARYEKLSARVGCAPSQACLVQ